jgi:hypothetical protein
MTASHYVSEQVEVIDHLSSSNKTSRTQESSTGAFDEKDMMNN